MKRETNIYLKSIILSGVCVGGGGVEQFSHTLRMEQFDNIKDSD
jgi:hypothetical protein